MNNLPFASIIVPAYNEENNIAECIESLLNQDYPKDRYEIIIVDNNSSDNTRQIIKRYPVVLAIEDKIKGPAAARNKGAAISKGDALVFFDADQIAERSWLMKLLNGWGQKEFGAFGGRNVAIASGEGLLGRFWRQNENTKTNMKSFPAAVKKDNRGFLKLGSGNAAYRREAFMRLRGFNVCLFGLEDYDLGLRLQKEFNYLVKYNLDAVIYHKSRPDYKTALKSEYRLGFGRYQFECRHPEFRTHLIIIFARIVKRNIYGLAALIAGLFLPHKEKSRREHIFLILFDISMRWANFLGSLEAAITRRKGTFPAYW